MDDFKDIKLHIGGNDHYKNIEDESSQLYIEISKKNKKKQFCLFVPLAIVVLFILYYQELMNTWYVSAGSLIGSWVVFWNYPQIGIFLQHKPIYIQDLVINNSSLDIRYKFINYYSYITNFFLALLVMCVADYALFKSDHEERPRSALEVAGIIGGLFSIYFKFQSVIGKLVLTICYKLKQRQVK